ncbi:MAG: hypothetical protein GEU78_14650 [Actinobacteria bacterium]|nr:hypothetical protein [Actinomycetota bacterium]
MSTINLCSQRSPRREGRPATFVRLSLMLAVLALAAACSGAEEDTGGDGDTAGDAGDAASPEAAGQEDGADPEGGGDTLTVAVGGEPSSLDVLTASDGLRDQFIFSVAEGLTSRAPDGEIVPALAESWEQDGSDWIFNLRQGVMFHNGEEMTAEDVVASYERMLTPGSEQLNQFLDEGTTVEAVDDYTVRVGRPESDPTVLTRTTHVIVVPAEYADPDDERINEELVATGPYRLAEWNKGQDIELERFDDYWGEAASVPNVAVRFITEDSVRLSALQTGEINLAATMPADLAPQAPNVLSGPVSETLVGRPNEAKPPFDDVLVRQAAAHAIDKEAIVEQIFGGYASLANGQPVGSYVFGANPDLEGYEYDPERARELLEEAGATGAEITWSASTGRWVNDRQVAEAMAGMLEEVGFSVTTRFPEWSVFLEEDAFPVGPTDEHPRGNDEVAPEIISYNTGTELFDSSQTLSNTLACAGPVSTYCNEELDALGAEALVELDEDRRAELYHEAWQMQHDDAALLSIADVHLLWFTDDVVQWEPPVNGFMKFQHMSLE